MATQKINNPFTVNEPDDYQCFGCSPNNPIGLQLKFYVEGNEVCCQWSPSKSYEGYVNVLHGGIQATLLDEIGGWLVYSQIGSAGVTKSLNINYLQPVYINDECILLKASLRNSTEREAVIDARLYNSAGKLCAAAEVVYFVFPESIARKKYHYPGKEAFYENDSNLINSTL
jgi:uncharacterized protein (TIGR00369 family)